MDLTSHSEAQDLSKKLWRLNNPELFFRSVSDCVTWAEFSSRLESGKKFRIKYGVDVTGPSLHIGHAVNLWLMRQLQDEGHKVVLLIGDFTTQIGDPTGRSMTRRELTADEIEPNVSAFLDHVSLILRREPELFEIRRNSEWYGSMGVKEFLGLLRVVTHSHLISRDMFQQRIADGSNIYMHELLYPILQGYDSYMLESDITIVGTDQLFNELMGRFYQERLGQAPQIVMTTRITPGLDGVQKQSKSLNNYVGLDDTARDKFGKLMSLPDRLIFDFLEVYSDLPSAEIDTLHKAVEAGEADYRETKLRMAEAIVSRYHGLQEAAKEREWFIDVFSKRNVPSDVPSMTVPTGTTYLDLLTQVEPSQSRSHWRRMATQGAIRFEDDTPVKLDDLIPGEANGRVIRFGKHKWVKIILGSDAG